LFNEIVPLPRSPDSILSGMAACGPSHHGISVLQRSVPPAGCRTACPNRLSNAGIIVRVWRRPISVMTSGVDPALLDSSSLSFPSRVPGADGRDRSGDILSGGCEAEGCKLVENLGVKVGNGRTDRAGRGSHPVHLSKMIGGPRGQSCAERLGGGHGDQTVVWSFQLAQHGVQPLERPGHLGAGRI